MLKHFPFLILVFVLLTGNASAAFAPYQNAASQLTEVHTAERLIHGGGSIKNPICFQGQYFDHETGLHYNRHRYYDPKIGRFISRDPIKYAGGLNLHVYMSNPIGWIDPFGLVPKFGTGKGQHAVTVEVLNSNGTLKNSTILKSGNMTSEEAALGFLRSAVATHTENRAMRQIPMEAGDTVTIRGKYPPCKSCKGVMNKKAAEVGCAINYFLPEGKWSQNK